MNDQQKVQLLPCPFCGQAPKHDLHANPNVWCDNDACAIVGVVFSGGPRHWNTRQAALAHASSASAEECSVDDHVAGVCKLVAACCGRLECGGECGNEWQGMIHADGFLAGIRDDGTVSGYAIETHYIPAKGFIDHGDFLAIVMDDNGCDAETRVTKSTLRHALGDSEYARPATSAEDAKDAARFAHIAETAYALRDKGHGRSNAFVWSDDYPQVGAGRLENLRIQVDQAIDQAIAGRRGDGNG